MMSLLHNTRIWFCLYVCYGFAALYFAFTFRLNLILDLFWNKTDQAVILEKEDFDGLLAGLPAGEGVTELTDIEQFYELKVSGFDTSNCEGWWDREEVIKVYPEYITFETDSIIPLGLYRINSKSDRSTYRHGRSGAKVTISEYTNSGLVGSLFFFNQYYLVGLPDGNYVLAHLDDAYYVKYLLAGKVQLPLGIAVTDFSELHLQPCFEEYGVPDDRILDMYCEKRYEDWSVLYHVVVCLLFPVLLYIGAVCGLRIHALLLKICDSTSHIKAS